MDITDIGPDYSRNITGRWQVGAYTIEFLVALLTHRWLLYDENRRLLLKWTPKEDYSNYRLLFFSMLGLIDSHAMFSVPDNNLDREVDQENFEKLVEQYAYYRSYIFDGLKLHAISKELRKNMIHNDHVVPEDHTPSEIRSEMKKISNNDPDTTNPRGSKNPRKSD